MAEGKSREEILLEEKLEIALAKERAAKIRAASSKQELGFLDIKKEDIVKGIVLKEILGTPKGFER